MCTQPRTIIDIIYLFFLKIVPMSICKGTCNWYGVNTDVLQNKNSDFRVKCLLFISITLVVSFSLLANRGFLKNVISVSKQC